MNTNKEVIMKDEKVKASVGADENLQEALDRKSTRLNSSH